MTWSEMPNYKDVVIPKSELYYRSKLVEQVDLSVEVHFWRRNLVVVKRFYFDLLTRDNIKIFKAEANIFQRLKHGNIVDFYGIVIDPPSIGIVMQYCSNGDLFKMLENNRTNIAAKNNGSNTTAPTESNSQQQKQQKHHTDEQSIVTTPSLEKSATNRSSLLVTDQHMIQQLKLIKSLESGTSQNPLNEPLYSGSSEPEENKQQERPITPFSRFSAVSRSRQSVPMPPRFDPLRCAVEVSRH
jgi:hypothetical protein